MLLATYAAGYYADRWVALVEPSRMTKVRAGAIVFATGVIEQPAVFRNNDLPGVMLGSAAQRLLHRFGIAPGRRVVILTANLEGYELARTLRANWRHRRGRPRSAGGVESATRRLGASCHEARVIPEEAIAGADGAVRALRFRYVTADSGETCGETIDCDAVLDERGLRAAANYSRRPAPRRNTTRPCSNICRPPCHRACSRPAASTACTSSTRAARMAAMRARPRRRMRAAGTKVPAIASQPEQTRQVSHPYPVFEHPRGRNFVDLDEDIQVKDLLTPRRKASTAPSC